MPAEMAVVGWAMAATVEVVMAAPAGAREHSRGIGRWRCRVRCRHRNRSWRKRDTKQSF